MSIEIPSTYTWLTPPENFSSLQMCWNILGM